MHGVDARLAGHPADRGDGQQRFLASSRGKAPSRADGMAGGDLVALAGDLE